MVQKSFTGVDETRKRGRPRAYDPDVALTKAMEVFWRHGFAAASLDDLSDATGMNRPSLYAAFGDKKALYAKALEHYRRVSREAMGDVFTRECTSRERLHLILTRALDLYLPDEGARGCFSVVTAASDAIADPALRALVVASIDGLDHTFARLLEDAIARGEIAEGATVEQRAQLATATLHSLSVRARAGVSRDKLEAMIDAAVATVIGPDPSPRVSPARR